MLDPNGANTTGLGDIKPANIRIHLTGYSGLRPLPPAGDAGRWADRTSRSVVRARSDEAQRRIQDMTGPEVLFEARTPLGRWASRSAFRKLGGN